MIRPNLLRRRQDRGRRRLRGPRDSLEAVKGFAGPEPEVARFYSEDDRYLVERDARARHYEVAAKRSGRLA